MKLLIVDDRAEMGILLRDLLADVPGLEIAGEAGDVPEALELVRTLRPDVVLLACANAGADHFFEKTTGLPELYRTLEELAGTQATGG
jgi:chemotaxis response regulator CheB